MNTEEQESSQLTPDEKEMIMHTVLKYASIVDNTDIVQYAERLCLAVKTIKTYQ